jgi:hypothetical protein
MLKRRTLMALAISLMGVLILAGLVFALNNQRGNADSSSSELDLEVNNAAYSVIDGCMIELPRGTTECNDGISKLMFDCQNTFAKLPEFCEDGRIEDYLASRADYDHLMTAPPIIVNVADGKPVYSMYLYLFSIDQSIPLEENTDNFVSLYDEVARTTGIRVPTFDQTSLIVTQIGVYEDSGRKIEMLPPARIIPSDSIEFPDGSKVVENEISSSSAFTLYPFSPAVIFKNIDGRVHAYHNDFYPNPNGVGPKQMVTVLALAVDASDYEAFNMRYHEVKEIIESFDPSA